MNIVPPIHCFTVPELEAVMEGAGFHIVESAVWNNKNAVHWIVARKQSL
jgi:hypothetical protein